MTATERLRELLDERGVEWSAVDDIDRHVTLWGVGEDGIAVFRGWSTGLTRFECTGLSPEQAVAATLGDGRAADLEELLRDMFAAMTMWASDECCQKWADRMESVGVYADWGWSG